MKPAPWRLTAPCSTCPFTRDASAIRLTAKRVREVAGNMLDAHGSKFSCHSTVDYATIDDDGVHRDASQQQHCAGALIFAGKHGKLTPWMVYGLLIRFWNPGALRGHERVFDSVDEMLRHALDAPAPASRRRVAPVRCRRRKTRR